MTWLVFKIHWCWGWLCCAYEIFGQSALPFTWTTLSSNCFPAVCRSSLCLTSLPLASCSCSLSSKYLRLWRYMDSMSLSGDSLASMEKRHWKIYMTNSGEKVGQGNLSAFYRLWKCIVNFQMMCHTLKFDNIWNSWRCAHLNVGKPGKL